MRRDLLIPGVISLLVAVGIYAGASTVASYLPTLFQGIGAVVVFVVLLAISLAEIPLMLYGLRQMARSSSTPRLMLVGMYAIYVAFGSVYASIFVLLTGQIVWGLALAALCVVRFASGPWIK